MTDYIVNAAPMIQQYGTEDLSTTRLPREPEVVAQHIPKFYLYTEKGPETPQLVSGAEAKLMYGSKTFDERSVYHNHATVFANLAIANANSIMVERVKPSDAGDPGKIQLWLDVLEVDEMPLYERNTDGSYKLDEDGALIEDGVLKCAGYKAFWVLTNNVVSAPGAPFGSLNERTGIQSYERTYTDGEGQQVTETVESIQYPILELEGSSFGNWLKNSGIRLWAPTVDDDSSLPRTMMEQEKAYPFKLSVIRRTDELSTPKAVPTLMGDQNIMFTFKSGVIDPTTDASLYLGDIFLDNYRNLSDPLFPKIFGDFGKIKVYTDNIETITDLFVEAERVCVNALDAGHLLAYTGWTDFNMTNKGTSWSPEAQLFNFVSGVSSQNAPYHAFRMISNNSGVVLHSGSNLYAGNCSDGTLSLTDVAGPNDTTILGFDSLVAEKMLAYLDPADPVQENALNVESIIYDSGFSIETKKALANIIALRKDTFVVLGVYQVSDDNVVNTATEEHSTAVALRQYLAGFPESEYFGTPVMRGMVVGRSGKLLNNRYKKRLPLTAEVLIKACRYMGAGNGYWKSTYAFDGGTNGNNIVENMYDINITWVPASVRNVNWAAGLMWVQQYDRRRFFFPAFKTVYPDDTSVLNSFFTAMAICQINKVTAAAWRQFVGVEGLTNAQLMERTNDFIRQLTTPARFDNRYIIEPAAYMTDADVLRGYSWTVPVKIYANNMKTVMTSYVQAYRMDDYAPAQ